MTINCFHYTDFFCPYDEIYDHERSLFQSYTNMSKNEQFSYKTSELRVLQGVLQSNETACPMHQEEDVSPATVL